MNANCRSILFMSLIVVNVLQTIKMHKKKTKFFTFTFVHCFLRLINRKFDAYCKYKLKSHLFKYNDFRWRSMNWYTVDVFKS